MKGLANPQRKSMGETPCQQVEQLLRDDGFLMLRSVRAEALFLERTLIPLQNFQKLTCAMSKAWGEFIFGRCLYEKRGSATVGFAWSVLCMQDFQGTQRELIEGLIVHLSFSLLGLPVSSSIYRINTREHQNHALVLFWFFLGKRKRGCFLSNVISDYSI